MSRKVMLISGAGAAVLVAAVALFLLVVAPSGSADAGAAVTGHVSDRADDGSQQVLAQQDWGDGQLVLVGYENRGVRKLGLAFASEQLRGWRVSAYTEQSVAPGDVQGIGSLLVAGHEGGGGQPAWSAAVGELVDPRVDRVEIRWSSGESSIGAVTNDAYLVVQSGTTAALEARYLAEDGTEIAKVPVE